MADRGRMSCAACRWCPQLEVLLMCMRTHTHRVLALLLYLRWPSHPYLPFLATTQDLAAAPCQDYKATEGICSRERA